MAGIDRALRKIQSGVYVITVKDGERINGMTAAWAMKASFKPPLVAVSIGKTRYSHGLIRNAGSFALNVLSAGQVEVGRRFGFQSGRNTDKFEGLKYETARTGAPILGGVAAWLDCTLYGECDAGDHTIFLGEVLEAAHFEGVEPLLFKRKDFF